MHKDVDQDPILIKSQNLLEFNKILDYTAQYAVSADAKEQIKTLDQKPLSQNPQKELILLEQFVEFLSLQNITLAHFVPISEELHFLSLDDSVLNITSFEKILQTCGNTILLKKLNAKAETLKFVEFQQYVSHFPELDKPAQFIHLVFDENFEIRDHASDDLKKIRNSIAELQKHIQKIFKKEVEQYRIKGFLAEGEESIRNGRFVLRVLAEHKRKIQGAIVGESETGKTVFLEPLSCLELNNKLVELELDEKREIHKILFALTGKIRVYKKELSESYSLLVFFDIMLAKARFSVRIQARKPEISANNKIYLHKAYHPLLLMKFTDEGRIPVPLTFQLNSQNRILLISGPNAGGKTIVLKTFGLLQLMLQRGFLVPAAKDSTFTIFTDIYTDLGDSQSLNDGLSTYSAKLMFMKLLAENTSQESLVLLDELGSGTEPVIGAAIAESILHEMVKKGAYGIITTHYSNLKAFAHTTKGILNGAMLYDEEEMQPRYILQLGKPGSSYALDIAGKLNFPKHLIEYAKRKAGKNLVHFEELISKLEKEKLSLKSKNDEFQLRIESLNKLIKAYENIQRQYEIKKLKLKLDTKQLEFQQQNFLKQQSHKAIDEIREKLDLIKAKQFEEKLQKQTLEISRQIDELNNQYTEVLRKEMNSKEINIGDKVHLLKHNLTGIVTEIHGKTAKVITEHFTIVVNKSELSQMPDSIINHKSKKVDLSLIEQQAHMADTIDLRGQKPGDALHLLENYLDKVLLTNLKEVRIVHGKGTGTLRNAIHGSLKKNKFIEILRHPDEADGGRGVTIVKFQ